MESWTIERAPIEGLRGLRSKCIWVTVVLYMMDRLALDLSRDPVSHCRLTPRPNAVATFLKSSGLRFALGSLHSPASTMHSRPVDLSGDLSDYKLGATAGLDSWMIEGVATVVSRCCGGGDLNDSVMVRQRSPAECGTAIAPGSLAWMSALNWFQNPNCDV